MWSAVATMGLLMKWTKMSLGAGGEQSHEVCTGCSAEGLGHRAHGRGTTLAEAIIVSCPELPVCNTAHTSEVET